MKLKSHYTLPKRLILGHIFECFDNTLYGFYAVLLAPIFFPSTSSHINLLASYGAFAAGFLARPVGAFVFGLIGDKKGRRLPLLWSMLLVGFPTIMIGLTPTYDSIGLWAPCILMLCRLTQGFCMGAEYTGINLYITENNSQKIGAQTGILISSGVYGAVLATALGAFFVMGIMPKWAWRIPFVFGGICSLGIYFIRKSIHETHDFKESKSRNEIIDFPWKHLLLNYKKAIFVAIILAGLTTLPLYLSTIFGNRLFKEMGYSPSESILLNMAAMIFNGIIITYYGKLADKIGFHRHMTFGVAMTALVGLPAFYLISTPIINIIQIYSFITILVSAGAMINGCAMPYIASLFPTHCRYSATSFSVTVGQALISGTTPLIASYLTDKFSSNIAPALWMVSVALLAFLGILWLGKEASSLPLKPVITYSQ
jgi:MHS family proline/betaine transporter-like MFS transporter